MKHRLLQLLASLRKRWLLTTIILGAIFLIVSALLRVLTPPESRQVTIPQNVDFQINYDETQSSFSDVTFSGTSPTIPTEFKVAKLEPTQISASDVQESLIREFNLRPLTTVENTWASDEYTLDKGEDDVYILTRNAFAAGEKVGIDQQQAIETAQAFLTKFFPNLDVQPLTSNIEFLTPGIETVAVPAAEADKARIPFTSLIDGFPVLYGTKSDYPFLIVVDNQYQIQKAFFYPQFISSTVAGKQKSLSIEDALQNIRRGNASITFANHQEWNGINLSTISKAEFTKVVIEYRIDTKSGLIYPFFHFTGTLQNVDAVPFTADVITPAVVLSRN